MKTVLLRFTFLFILAVPSHICAQEAVNLSRSSSPSYDASIAVNDDGDVCVVWVEELYAGHQQIYGSILHGGSWYGPSPIPNQGTNCQNPHVSKGRGGTGFCCVWHDASANVIMFCEYGSGGWSGVSQISDRGQYMMGFPKIAATTNNRIVAAWQSGTSSTLNPEIFTRIWNGGWGAIQNISDTFNGVSKAVDLAPGPDGRVYAVWQDNVQSYWDANIKDWVDIFEVMFNSDNGNGNWHTSYAATDQNEWLFKANLAVNDANSILITTYYFQRASYHGIFRNNNEWSGMVQCSDFGDHHDHDWYWADVCAYGNGFLFIYRDIGYNIVYRAASNQYFGNPVTLSGSGWTFHPCIDYSPAAGAAAAWTELGNDEDIFAVVFSPEDAPTEPVVPPPPPPPQKTVYPPVDVVSEYQRLDYQATGIAVEFFENRNVFTIQYMNKMTWAPSLAQTRFNPPMSKYRIFRRRKGEAEWAVLDEIDADQLEYWDKKDLKPGISYEYSVMGIDNTGNSFYAFHRISWADNPKNRETEVMVKQFRIYRKRTDEGEAAFSLWRQIDSALTLQEDHSDEIRSGILFDYAVSALDDSGKESVRTVAESVGRPMVIRKIDGFNRSKMDTHHSP